VLVVQGQGSFNLLNNFNRDSMANVTKFIDYENMFLSVGLVFVCLQCFTEAELENHH